ncbi:MAG: hypothetical protein HZB22_03615 [Deltaproteobacteria bacterium]|nr:hypothetical protein [Deltaproteobacteria bacterium]
MKNPLRKVFKKPALKTQMYNELRKIGKKLDRELGVISGIFNKEVSALKKKGAKIDIEKELAILHKTGDRLLKDLNKKAGKVMAGVKKDYALAIKSVKKRIK